MKIFRLTPERQVRWAASLRQLEKEISYPLGNDRFRIDHGENYFAFFERLGEVFSYVAVDQNQVVAVGTGVRRVLNYRGKKVTAWYLCDLKVARSFRNQRLPRRIFQRAFPLNYLRCPRGYAVSMDPEGSTNRVVNLIRRLSFLPMGIAPALKIFSLDRETMLTAEPWLKKHRGPFSYLSYAGVKDLILESTGQPMQLMHLQFGGWGKSSPTLEPQAGHWHMFCAPVGDPLLADLATVGVLPTASASVIHHRMTQVDWRFILTSDI